MSEFPLHVEVEWAMVDQARRQLRSSLNAVVCAGPWCRAHTRNIEYTQAMDAGHARSAGVGVPLADEET